MTAPLHPRAAVHTSSYGKAAAALSASATMVSGGRTASGPWMIEPSITASETERQPDKIHTANVCARRACYLQLS